MATATASAVPLHLGRERDAVDERCEEHDRQEHTRDQAHGGRHDRRATSMQVPRRTEQHRGDRELGEGPDRVRHRSEREEEEPEGAREDEQHAQIREAVYPEVGGDGLASASDPVANRRRHHRWSRHTDVGRRPGKAPKEAEPADMPASEGSAASEGPAATARGAPVVTGTLASGRARWRRAAPVTACKSRRRSRRWRKPP